MHSACVYSVLCAALAFLGQVMEAIRHMRSQPLQHRHFVGALLLKIPRGGESKPSIAWRLLFSKPVTFAVTVVRARLDEDKR